MTNDPVAARALLLAERDHAQRNVDRLAAEYDAVLVEQGALQEDRDNIRAVLEAARLTLEGATAAVEQLAAGSYGRCQRCGGEIGAERLEALPGTTTCVTCQAAS
jgi:RNA polymerase-binding transcription factor DksA